MDDTPHHIKDLQLKIWLSKPPMERLRQCIFYSEQFYKMIEQAKQDLKKRWANAMDLKQKLNSSPSTKAVSKAQSLK